MRHAAIVLSVLTLAAVAGCSSSGSGGPIGLPTGVPTGAASTVATGAGTSTGSAVASGGGLLGGNGTVPFVNGTVVVHLGDFTDTTINSSTNTAWMHNNDVCTPQGPASGLLSNPPVTVTAAGQTIGQGPPMGGSATGVVGYYNAANPIVCDIEFHVPLSERPGSPVTVAIGSVASTTVTPDQLGDQVSLQVGF